MDLDISGRYSQHHRRVFLQRAARAVPPANQLTLQWNNNLCIMTDREFTNRRNQSEVPFIYFYPFARSAAITVGRYLWPGPGRHQHSTFGRRHPFYITHTLAPFSSRAMYPECPGCEFSRKPPGIPPYRTCHPTTSHLAHKTSKNTHRTECPGSSRCHRTFLNLREMGVST